VFWVSVFEDEASFRRNAASLGYDFGERLVYWEAPVAGAEAFFSTLLDAVARERPEALVIDSVTEVLAAGGGLDIIHNVLYRAVKQSGVDVFLTAEKEVAPKVAYVAANVVELIHEVYPHGAVREAVVRKICGGRTGFSLPFIIREGEGVLFLAPAAPVKVTVERLETVTCLDEAVGGLYKGLLRAVVGPVGAGTTWLMLKAAKVPKEKGRKVMYVVEALATLYGPAVLHMVLRILFQTARGGRAVVVSLRDLHDPDMLFDVIVKMEERNAVSVRGPGGKIGEKVWC
jgi:circadian clock protein KaiC